MTEGAPATKFSFRAVLVCLALVIVTSGIYWQLGHAPFVVYDDAQYVTDNPAVRAGLSWAGVKWAFAGSHEANWHPLTWLSHMLDCQMFGLDAGKHHLVNLLFHVANSLLLFGLLRSLTGAFWRSAIVAGLFAWHPMHVESVAWIAERKDVLSTFFMLLTVLAYASYCRSLGSLAPKNGAQKTEIKSGKSRRFYFMTLFLFTLALLSKPMAVTLPFLLLLLDYWPLKRKASWRILILEKLPLMVLSLISCLITCLAQAKDGAMSNYAIPPDTHLYNLFISYVRYVKMLLWPARLAVIYPYDFAPAVWKIAGALIALLLISGAAWQLRRRNPYLLIGWCWFLGTLIPVIGLIQVGKQSIADRYTYFPAIGLFIAIIWLAAEWVESRPAFKKCAIGLTLAMLAGCVWAATKQAGNWENSEILFRHAIEVTSANEVAEYNLAFVLQNEGQPEEAATHYRNSLRIDPNQNTAECNLGACLAKLGRHEEALVHYEKALQLNAGESATHLDYGLSLAALGKTNDAIAQYQEAIRLDPGDYKVRFTLGTLYLAQNRYPEAQQQFEESIRLAPRDPAPHLKLASTLNALGQLDAAVAEYQTALNLNPDTITALNDLAWIRAASWNPAFRNGPEAVRLARRACELSHDQEPLLIGTLADAYAEAGQFKEAEATAIKARDLALAHGLKQIAAKNDELLKLYQAHQAYHDEAPSK